MRRITKEKLKKVGTGLLAVFCVLYVIPSVLQVAPQLAGADHSYTVVSGSMRPALKRGDIALVEEVNASDPSSIQEGDIVAMRAGERVVTHRVVDKKGDPLYLTKGDANEDPDGWVEPERIIGVVTVSMPTSVVYSVLGFAVLYLIPNIAILVKGGHSFYAALSAGMEKLPEEEPTEEPEREETEREERVRKALEEIWGEKLHITAEEKPAKFEVTSKVKPEYRERFLRPKITTEVVHRGMELSKVIERAREFVKIDIKDAKGVVLSWVTVSSILILFVSVVRLFLPVLVS